MVHAQCKRILNILKACYTKAPKFNIFTHIKNIENIFFIGNTTEEPLRSYKEIIEDEFFIIRYVKEYRRGMHLNEQI